MAGAKESPRQRMIGMMYLVLTALLALQIKDTVLEKFVLMEGGLETSNGFYEKSNSDVLASITKAAADQGNKEQDLAVVNAAGQVRQKTDELVTYLADLKAELGMASAKGDTAKIYRRATLKKYEEPSRVLVEEKGADELEAKLNDYNAEVSQILSSVNISRTWPSLALKASDFKLYNNRPDEKKKSYADFNFYKSPLASVLAQLTFYQNQIFGREAEALSLLGAAVGAESLKGFDVITPTVLPVSNIVTAGTDFEAELFLTASNSAITPEMTMGTRTLDVDADGKGKITFPARAADSEYDANGLAKKTFTAEIKFNNGGEEVTRDITHEYYVAKPTISVGLNAVSALYLNCANNLKIDVPSLGPAYQPSFNVTGGKATKGSRKEDVTIVPNQRNVKVGVSSAGIFIDNVEFTARTAPLPAFKLQINGKDYDPNAGLGSAPANVTLFLVVDAEFRSAYPDDAKYFVTKGKVTLARGRNAVRQIPINGRTLSVDLGSIRAIARKGDRIVVEIEEITRYNFENQPEPFTFGETRIMTIN